MKSMSTVNWPAQAQACKTARSGVPKQKVPQPYPLQARSSVALRGVSLSFSKPAGKLERSSKLVCRADGTSDYDVDVDYEPPIRPAYIPGRIDDPKYVRIFDTTLRDGEQSPGATLTSKEKMEVARQLHNLGVDIIEAGFPIASPDDHEAVKNIAIEVGNTVDAERGGYVPVICGLSRANSRDIDAAWSAVKHAERPRIHTFIATSKIHMESKLRKTPDEVVEIAVNAVKYAKSLGCNDIEFSPEDAGRSDPVFLYRILAAVIEAGATTVNIPDTVGVCTPVEFGELIAGIKANTKGIENAIISTHCQNDLGLSTANSIAGVANGARQIESTINGIGERAGNASLEEVAMTLLLRGKSRFDGLYTGINPRYITPASRMVSEYTGMLVQPHKAIVGANAFAHESGIHQDGMLKNKLTYEIMPPELIGIKRTNDAGIVMGKHSGRHALRTRVEELGYTYDQQELDEIFIRFKKVAETKGGGITDEDLMAIITDEVLSATEIWKLIDLQVVCGTMGMPTATVKMEGPDGMLRMCSAVGSGPIDAAYKAVDALVCVKAELKEYGMSAVTSGINALATTRVTIEPASDTDAGYTQFYQGNVKKRTFTASGTESDIVTSSVQAYVHALNKMIGFIAAQSGDAEQKTTPSEDTIVTDVSEPQPAK